MRVITVTLTSLLLTTSALAQTVKTLGDVQLAEIEIVKPDVGECSYNSDGTEFACRISESPLESSLLLIGIDFAPGCDQASEGPLIRCCVVKCPQDSGVGGVVHLNGRDLGPRKYLFSVRVIKGEQSAAEGWGERCLASWPFPKTTIRFLKLAQPPISDEKNCPTARS